jgi:hypothetical protein
MVTGSDIVGIRCPGRRGRPGPGSGVSHGGPGCRVTFSQTVAADGRHESQPTGGPMPWRLTAMASDHRLYVSDPAGVTG